MLHRIFSRQSAGEPINKFSPAYFTQLHSILTLQLSRPSLQPEIVIAALKELGEVMVWAGKSDGKDVTKARMAEMFGELGVMKTIVSLHKCAYGSAPDVQQQVLQTLSIVLNNMGEAGGSLFFLLSNNHINELMQAPFEEGDEEVLGYYVSLLKTLSVAFNESTVNFFFTRTVARKGSTRDRAQEEPTAEFPMYTRALSYADDREGMVRAAVRTLTLNVYRLADPAVHSFLVQQPQAQYAQTVARRLKWLILQANAACVGFSEECRAGRYEVIESRCHGCVEFRKLGPSSAVLAKEPAKQGSPRSQPRLAADVLRAMADIEDELYYLQDVFGIAHAGENSGCTTFQPMADLFMTALLDEVLEPLLIGRQESLKQQGHRTVVLDPACRLHLLKHMLRIFTYAPLRAAIIDYLVRPASAVMDRAESYLDALLRECVNGSEMHVLNAAMQLLDVLSSLKSVELADVQRKVAWDDAIRLPQPVREIPRKTSESALGKLRATATTCDMSLQSVIARWCTAVACESASAYADNRAVFACVILARLVTLRPSALQGGHILALASAVRTLACCIQESLVSAREEDPIGAIGMLAALECAAGEDVASSHVLAAAVYAATELEEAQGRAWKGEARVGRAGSTDKRPAGRGSAQTDADISAQASDVVQKMRKLALAYTSDKQPTSSPWAVEGQISGAAGEEGAVSQYAVWYSSGGHANTGEQDRRAGDVQSMPAFVSACHQLFRLRALLCVVLGRGVSPLLQAARGSLSQAQSFARHVDLGSIEAVIDDLAYGAYVADESIKLVAPPVDSIRPGNVFTLSSFPFVTAVHYPVATGGPAPVARGLPAGFRDALAPLSAAVASQRRVAVVLGQSYLVLALILSPKAGTAAASAAAAAGAPPRVRGRAILVAPLHATFITPLSDAPSIVDVRVITPDEAVTGTAQDLGPWNPPSRLRVIGFALAFDLLDAPNKAVAHVEAARARVLMSKVDEVLSLATVNFR